MVPSAAPTGENPSQTYACVLGQLIQCFGRSFVLEETMQTDGRTDRRTPPRSERERENDAAACDGGDQC